MSKPLIQIDDLVREMTDEEYETYQTYIANKLQQQLEIDAKTAARESALAKLSELGLTAEEVSAIL